MKSPLTGKPLRNPGQSIDRQIIDVVFDQVMQPMMVALIFTIMALAEWWRWYFNVPPKPWLWTAVALVTAAFFAWKVHRSLRKVRSLALGRDGEHAVGQFLEALREDGARVLHDFPGEGFNIDHAVVHASGVYAVETKTFSKPDRGEAKVVFDGEVVSVNGRRPDRNPVVQARAGAQWLKTLIKDSSARTIAVRPVVVFPGWFVEVTAEAKGSDVWVLNPKALPSFIGKSRPQLEPHEVQLVAFHLSRFARSIESAK